MMTMRSLRMEAEEKGLFLRQYTMILIVRVQQREERIRLIGSNWMRELAKMRTQTEREEPKNNRVCIPPIKSN